MRIASASTKISARARRSKARANGDSPGITPRGVTELNGHIVLKRAAPTVDERNHKLRQLVAQKTPPARAYLRDAKEHLNYARLSSSSSSMQVHIKAALLAPNRREAEQQHPQHRSTVEVAEAVAASALPFGARSGRAPPPPFFEGLIDFR